MHDINIDLLREEACRLVKVETDFLKEMLDTPDLLTDMEGQSFTRESAHKRIEILQEEANKLEKLEMVLAVVGTMKAGKSTTINAIVGAEVLPSRNEPMTAIPTLIRHKVDQKEPILSFEHTQPVIELAKKLGDLIAKMTSEQLEMLHKELPNPEIIDSVVARLKPKTKYSGSEQIFVFLKQLNDLVRLANALEIEFPFSEYEKIYHLPVIEVEFVHLREVEAAKGQFALLDTPGPNEAGQEQLKAMLTEQLRKASGVLAVMDYTQLRSDADHQVREELRAIASVTGDRMFALVNKFDQKDRNGLDEKGVKALVADGLMEGEILQDSVFPVSANWAYLANRARHELYQAGNLPDADENEWVADFGEEGLGKRWHRKINDLDEVNEAIEALWEDSMFAEPLDQVIQKAHGDAAFLALDSAVAKLQDTLLSISNLVNLRSTALSKDIDRLFELIGDLKADIDEVNRLEKEVKKKSDGLFEDLKDSVESIFDRSYHDMERDIEEYFKEGKLEEKKRYELEAVSKKAGLGESHKGIYGHLLSDFFSLNAKKKEKGRDFNSNASEIRFDTKEEERSFIETIEDRACSLFSNINDEVSERVLSSTESFSLLFEQEVVYQSKNLLDRLNKKMEKEGFQLDINVPQAGEFSRLESEGLKLAGLVKSKSEKKVYRVKQRGAWGGVKRFFDFFDNDWGYEEREKTVKYRVINLDALKNAVTQGLNQSFSALRKEVNKQTSGLKTQQEAAFSELREVVESLRSDLLASERDHRLNQDKQKALMGFLELLVVKVVPVKEDLDGLVGDRKSLAKEASE
ncbi:dynamin family protein [Pontibacterium granulatum]|uniref:dynamin family protein n=1 Tax=Pontibacterium granulatum TaxID=2036029 RepID=UPI00249A2C79|nr:dynamin family protein [Pontibacterium granulatum]MDI3323402.1 dynamin family protein [Pontibacterium granulatum]